MAVDLGGIQCEMYSAFWEKAYQLLFEGATTLIPMIHPQTDVIISCYWSDIISWVLSCWGITSSNRFTNTCEFVIRPNGFCINRDIT